MWRLRLRAAATARGLLHSRYYLHLLWFDSHGVNCEWRRGGCSDTGADHRQRRATAQWAGAGRGGWPRGDGRRPQRGGRRRAKLSLPTAWLLLHALFCVISMAMGFRFSRLIVYLLFLATLLINPVIHLRGANGAAACIPDLISDKAKPRNPADDCSTRDGPRPFAGHRCSEKTARIRYFPGPIAFAVCRCGQSKHQTVGETSIITSKSNVSAVPTILFKAASEIACSSGPCSGNVWPIKGVDSSPRFWLP
jgi:hypothetical protein